jgi:hypothetical protein
LGNVSLLTVLSKWVPFLQIETASVGDDFGGSRLNNNTKDGTNYRFWTNMNRVWWRWIDIRDHVVRLVGIVEHTASMKARHAAPLF